jgi:hypothetical protein
MLIIADKKTFTLVEHPIFKAFISSLQPKFKLYGRTTIKKDILNMYNSLKETVAREIPKWIK